MLIDLTTDQANIIKNILIKEISIKKIGIKEESKILNRINNAIEKYKKDTVNIKILGGYGQSSTSKINNLSKRMNGSFEGNSR